MLQPHFVHLIDASASQRAGLARAISAHGLHPEIYESIDELRGAGTQPCYPAHGAVLISDDDGIDLAAALNDMREAACFLPAIAYTTAAPVARRIVGALRAGMVDYLCFPGDMVILGSTVEAMIEHAESLARHYEMTALARARLARLTRQERRVLEAVIAGATSKEAGRQMGLSNRTVEVHRAAVLQKLEVATTAGAIAMGISAGILAGFDVSLADRPSAIAGVQRLDFGASMQDRMPAEAMRKAG